MHSQFFLIQDNTTHLNTGHEYYAQIQGQLLISGCDFCEFIVYTHKDLFVQRVLPDLHFMGPMLEKLCQFMTNHIKPKIQKLERNALSWDHCYTLSNH